MKGFRGHLVFLVTAFTFVVADLWSKTYVFELLSDRDPPELPVWDGVFMLKLVENPGMMWGMAQGVPALWWVVIRGVVLVCLVALYATLDRRTRLTQFAFGLVAAGAIGNIADNVFQGERLFEGAVRDFLHFYWFEFPTFNVADACICVGAPLLLLVLWNHDRRRVHAAPTVDSSA